MKQIKTWYWILTALVSALMLFSALPSVVPGPEHIAFFESLGYAAYIIPFLSIAKILGVIGILVPGYPRLREWAYAGLTFDLVGALYSCIMTAQSFDGATIGGLVFIGAAIAMLLGSYFLAIKKDRLAVATS